MHSQPSAPEREREQAWVHTEDEAQAAEATEAHERDEAEALGITLAELRQREGGGE
ncbi:MAG TPA: hypothetical protein VLK89_01485 [Solirubrobacterales bacterium]|nr:hypothetical protein [Solirubrobacterales bacterium]